MAIKKEIIIQARIEGDEAVKKRVESLNETIESTGKVGETAQERYSGSIKKSSPLVEKLDQQTGGLASSLLDVGDAARKSGKAMRTQLLASGIGALVLIVGQIVANWDAISEAIGLSSNKLQDKIDFQERSLDLLEDEYSLLELEEKNLELQGESLEEIRKEREANLKLQIESNNELLKTLELQLESERSANRKVTLWEKIKIGIAGTLNPLGQYQQITRSVNDESERSLEIEDEIQKAKERSLQLENALLGIDKDRKKESDNRLKNAEREAELEEKRLAQIEKVEEKFRERKRDLEAQDAQAKLDLQRERAEKELELLIGSEEEKREAKLAIDEFFDAKEDELATLKREKEEQQERDRLQAIADIQDEFRLRREDEAVELESERLELEKERQLEELDELQATEQQKADIISFFDEKIKQARVAEAKEAADQELDDEKRLQNAKIALASQTFNIIGSLAKEGSALAKGIAVAQATISTFKGINAALSAESVVPDPVGAALKFANATAIGVTGFLNVRKILSTQPVSTSAPSGGGTANAPAAPSFNLVEGSGTNQIAESIAGEQTPIKAYVVSQDVTSQQSLDRNIESTSTI